MISKHIQEVLSSPIAGQSSYDRTHLAWWMPCEFHLGCINRKVEIITGSSRYYWWISTQIHKLVVHTQTSFPGPYKNRIEILSSYGRLPTIKQTNDKKNKCQSYSYVFEVVNVTNLLFSFVFVLFSIFFILSLFFFVVSWFMCVCVCVN